MKRTLALCLMLPGLLLCSGAVFAAPPASAPGAESDVAVQRQMAALQERMNALASRMAALSSKLGDEANASALHYLADSRRGMLGLVADSDAAGLRVAAVTPGGPAEQAGIRDGDVITAIDGEPARKGGTTALGRKLVAGKPLDLSVLRDGKTMQLRVTPERFQAGDWQEIARAAQRAADEATASMRSPEFQKQIQQSIDDAMKSASAALDSATIARESASAAREAVIRARENGRHWAVFMSPWWGLNLAPLNPDLGRYFGTDKGVLVLSRSDTQFPELQPGDVITGIGGKSVAQPEDVQRALRGASNDKRVRVAVRRHGKALSLAMKVPPRWNLLPPPPPPAPPLPPKPAKIAAPPIPPPPPAPSTTPTVSQ